MPLRRSRIPTELAKQKERIREAITPNGKHVYVYPRAPGSSLIVLEPGKTAPHDKFYLLHLGGPRHDKRRPLMFRSANPIELANGRVVFSNKSQKTTDPEHLGLYKSHGPSKAKLVTE